MRRKYILLSLTLALLAASSRGKREQHPSGKVSVVTNTPRPLTLKDIKSLPDVLTAAELFDELWAVELPDPPFFIYPSETPGHQYIAFAHPDDSEALDHEDFSNVRIACIVHFRDDLRKAKAVWGKDPFITLIISEHDPFSIDKPSLQKKE